MDSSGLNFKLKSANQHDISLEASAAITVRVSAAHESVRIYSDTFIPDRQSGNGDLRTIGVRLSHVRLVA